MVKLVTVVETQACRACRSSGHSPNGTMCPVCNGSGSIAVEVVR